MFCTNCGKELPDGLRFCTKCGHPLSGSGNPAFSQLPDGTQAPGMGQQPNGNPVPGMGQQPAGAMNPAFGRQPGVGPVPMPVQPASGNGMYAGGPASYGVSPGQGKPSSGKTGKVVLIIVAVLVVAALAAATLFLFLQRGDVAPANEDVENESVEDSEEDGSEEDGPAASEEGEKDQKTDEGKLPEEAQGPETSEEAQEPEASDEGQAPDMPDEGQEPEEAQGPETSEEAQEPEASDEGQAPDMPDEGQPPEEIQGPETSDEAQEPERPLPVSMSYVYDVTASSELTEKSGTHWASFLCDGDLDTAWVEGVDGNGAGESVMISFDGVYLLSGLRINAGYQKSESLYEKNARPSSLVLAFSDGTQLSVVLEDLYDVQYIDFPEPVESSFVTILIGDAYLGDTYEDLCISEVAFY